MNDDTHTLSRQAGNNILILATIAFAAGIAWGAKAPPGIDTFIWPAIILLAFIIFIFYRRPPSAYWRDLTIYLLLPFFFLLGAIRTIPFNKPPTSPSHIYNLINNNQEAAITGILLEAPSTKNSKTGRRTQLVVEVEELRLPGFPATGALTTQGKIQLTLQGNLPSDLTPGDLLIARAQLSRVRPYTTPGAFNYRKFLAAKKIWLTGWLKNPAALVKIHKSDNAGLTTTYYHRLRYLPERIRHQMARFLGTQLPEQSRGLYKAILIGDRSEIPANILADFKTAGCMHILAISGLHMGLLAMLSLGLLTWLFKRSTWLILHISVLKTAALLSLLPITGYALIAGFNIPVVRALLMTVVFILSVIFDRQKSLYTNIAIAALIILTWQPVSLYSAGFQLSFAAVIAIAIIYPLIHHLLFESPSSSPTAEASPDEVSAPGWKRPFTNWLLAGICVSVAATLGTAPLLIYHFNRFSLVGPISGLLVEPLICFWSLLLGLGACLLAPVLPEISGYLLQAGSWGLTAAAALCGFMAKLPFAEFWLATPSPMAIMLYYCMLFCAVSCRRYLAVFGTTICLLLLVTLPIYTSIASHLNRATSVTFLDVGQGSSTVLEMPQGKAILIDGGGAISERFNVGERIIAPFLWQRGYRRLKGVVVSHPHEDHFNGLAFVIEKFRPEKLWINGRNSNENAYCRLIELARQAGVKIIIPEPGSIMLQSGDAILKCVNAPPLPDAHEEVSAKGSTGGGSTINNLSLVVKLIHHNNNGAGDVSFLFPGDIDGDVEKELVATGKKVNADILLAAHHGSKGSNSNIFLEKVAPRYLVVSASRLNPFEFHTQDFLEHGRWRGIEMLATYKDGSLSFTTDGKSVSMRRYQSD